MFSELKQLSPLHLASLVLAEETHQKSTRLKQVGAKEIHAIAGHGQILAQMAQKAKAARGNSSPARAAPEFCAPGREFPETIAL